MAQFATVELPLGQFMIQFLRGAFPQPRKIPFFQFPKSHDIESAIQILAKGVEGPAEESKEFKIQFSVPLWKTDYKHFTLTEKSIQILKRRIKNYYGIVAHDFLSQRRNEGYEIKDCIYLFFAKYEIEPTDTNYERVKKDFDRWRNRQAAKKYRKNQQKKNRNCPPPA